MSDSVSNSRSEASRRVKAVARECGFQLVGIAPAVSPPGFPQLQEWIRAGYAGEMAYLPRREAAYEHPRHVSPPVRSLILVAVDYQTQAPQPTGPTGGRVARYAWGTADYHDLLRTSLRRLADQIHGQFPGVTTRIAVDTAPLLERDYARLAGLGWFGKNTLLINKRQGSWLLLGAVLTDLDLEPDEPHATSHCGTCTRCLDVCPTEAFVAPCVLDARRCISYLTIELRGPIPEPLREGLGQWLFGCDLCQDVCPWNRKPAPGGSAEFSPREGLNPADPLEILQMTPDTFQQRFSGTPLDRPGFDGLRRNAAIVVGNTRDRRAQGTLVRLLEDSSPLVRGACAWALGQLGGPSVVEDIERCLLSETDASVREELGAARCRCLTP